MKALTDKVVARVRIMSSGDLNHLRKSTYNFVLEIKLQNQKRNHSFGVLHELLEQLSLKIVNYKQSVIFQEVDRFLGRNHEQIFANSWLSRILKIGLAGSDLVDRIG